MIRGLSNSFYQLFLEACGMKLPALIGNTQQEQRAQRGQRLPGSVEIPEVASPHPLLPWR